MDDSGNIYVTGSFSGTVDFGDGERPGVGNRNVFVLKLAPDGTYAWDRTFPGSDGEGVAIAVDNLGNVVILSIIRSNVDFGGGRRDGSVPKQSIVVVGFSSEGIYRWDYPLTYVDPHSDEGGLAVGAAGNIYFTSSFNSAYAFGTAPPVGSGNADVFVLSLTAAGAYRWHRTYGSTGIDSGASVAATPSGTVLFTGQFEGSVDFGGGAQSASASDIFVLALDSDGGHVWDRTFGGTRDDRGCSIATNVAGRALVTGSIAETVDFGGGPRSTVSLQQAFILALEADGSYLWDRIPIRAGVSSGTAIAVGDGGAVYVTGSVEAVVDFGGGLRTGFGLADILVVGFDSAGAYRWDRVFGGAGNDDSGKAIAVGAMGQIFIGGSFDETVDFGGGDHTASGSSNAFLVALSP